MAYSKKKLTTYGTSGILIAAIIIASIQVQFLSGKGTLTIFVTDPPEWGDVTHVYINVTAIEIHNNVSGWMDIPIPGSEDYITLNLTEILDTEQELLVTELDAGKYNQIRFEIMSALVTVDGDNRTADVPSGKLKITIIQGGITIEGNGNSNLLVDIETKIVYSKGQNQYKLVPSAKAIPLSD
jgi:hypothetical protein